MAVPVEELRSGRVTDEQLAELGRWAGELVNVLGTRVMRSLAQFSRDAEPGAMLTVRCTRDGFTAQTTGPIVGGRPEPLTLDAIDILTREAD